MQKELSELRKQNAELIAQNQRQCEQIDELTRQNRLLQQKVQVLIKRLFGSKSEKLDPNQLELLLTGMESSPDEEDRDDEPAATSSRPKRKPRESKPRIPENLRTEDVYIDPEEVLANPDAFECIGEEITSELDVSLPEYFHRRIIRRKYKKKEDRSLAPIIAPLPPRLIEGGYASPGLLTDIVLKKYVDHLPLYRQEQILRSRFDIDLSRKTMCDWIRVVADWLKPIYNYLREILRQSGYLQIDETPIRYCRAEGGGSKLGYFWIYHHPSTAGGEVLYEWHTSRSASCLEEMLGDYSGEIQCDGYQAYISFIRGREDIYRSGCWAHARRMFHEALGEAPALAGWFIHQIQLLYSIERKLRDDGAGPAYRQAVRAAQSQMILNRIRAAVEKKRGACLPSLALGKAINYTLGEWEGLIRYVQDGRIEIDNNLVENAARPPALGKKNWMFIGDPEAGERSAIIYTLLENCRRLGINPQVYLKDVLTRLPTMLITDIAELAPANWLNALQKNAA